jgi:hypothetical protein
MGLVVENLAGVQRADVEAMGRDGLAQADGGSIAMFKPIPFEQAGADICTKAAGRDGDYGRGPRDSGLGGSGGLSRGTSVVPAAAGALEV